MIGIFQQLHLVEKIALILILQINLGTESITKSQGLRCYQQVFLLASNHIISLFLRENACVWGRAQVSEIMLITAVKFFSFRVNKN